MIKQLKTSTGVAAGLAALALGGSAIASAASTSPTKAKPTPTHASSTAPDTDNIQSGDQTSPDRGTKAQSSAPETRGESGGESAPNNDRPGGHADEPGNPNADTQQQGQN